MPLYNFECNECEYEVEYLISLPQYENQEFETNCPVCKSILTRQLTPLHFRLVGSTWHRDGYSGGVAAEHKEAIKENDMHQRNADKFNAQQENLDAI